MSVLTFTYTRNRNKAKRNKLLPNYPILCKEVHITESCPAEKQSEEETAQTSVSANYENTDKKRSVTNKKNLKSSCIK
jgi:hypothetical protein